MKLSLILEAVDRMSAPARKAASGIKGISAAAKPAAKAIDGVNRQVTRVSANTIKWTRLALRSADAIDRTTDRVRALGRALALSTKWAGLKALELGARGAGGALGFAAGKAADLVLSVARWGALGVAAGATWLVAGTIGIASQFEQYQAQLEGTEGSVEKAKKALAWVSKFAQETPYELAEVTDAFARARGVGIDPMTGAMRAMGDAASGARKDLMSAIEAVADAQTGEFERLKEFNITSSVKGDKVTFSYINKAGKDAERSVTKSMASIRQAVLQIFDEKYGGAMIRRSKTFEGIWSNIKDKLAGIQLKVANAGFFDVVKDKLQGLLEWLDKMEADGSLQKWAKGASERLTEMVEAGSRLAKDVPWADIGRGIGAIASAAASAAAWLGKAVAALREYRYESARRFLDGQMNGWFVNDEKRGQIRQQIDQLDRDFGKKKDAPYKGPQLRSGVRGARGDVRPAFAPPLKRQTHPSPLLPGRIAPKWPSAPAPTGKLEISIKTQPGTTATPTKVAAKGMDVEVNTGRRMGAFA